MLHVSQELYYNVNNMNTIHQLLKRKKDQKENISHQIFGDSRLTCNVHN